jgi:dihydroorotase
MTLIDLEKKWTVEPEKFRSKSRNTPFAGMELTGAVVKTIVGGKVVYED